MAELETLNETPTMKLSFCIPTLNREAFIGATLESIISQATDEVEIVVVDGGSTKNTEGVVHEYQRRFRSIRYFRGRDGLNSPPPPGTGFDRDCNRAVELAQGEYCWLFTDDDLLKPGTVSRVLKAIRSGYGLIIVNAEVRGPDLSKILRKKLLRMDADRIYKPTENQRLFIDVGNYLSFLGGVVIRRDLWTARDREKYFGTGFIHVGVIFQTPIPDETLVIAEPLVSIRFGNALWGPLRFDLWAFVWPNLIWSFPHFTDSAKSQVSPREPWRSVKFLLLQRAHGAFSLEKYSSSLKSHLGTKWTRLLTVLIARFPAVILNLLGVIYCSVIHPSSRVALVDLMNSPYYFRNRLKQISWHRS